MSYLAPEYVLTMSCDTYSDMYSLGNLAYTLCNEGKPLLQDPDWSKFKAHSNKVTKVTILVFFWHKNFFSDTSDGFEDDK